MPTRQERLDSLGQPEAKWASAGTSTDIKLGQTTDVFYAGDDEGLRAKSHSVGFTIKPDGSVIVPGRTLSFLIKHDLVDFDGKSFHPLADQHPSTAVLPYPVFVSKIVDPDLEELSGILGDLLALVELF